MKTVSVVAAMIVDDNRILAAQRGYGELKGKWEFPGGKIEPGETKQEALVREIEEELQIHIEVSDSIGTVEYDYPNFHLSMTCFICKLCSGNITLMEHLSTRWVKLSELMTIDWLPADVVAVNMLNDFFEHAR